ncbi:hypothetical protein NKI39_33630, partial [Mesorhizobium sp. M0664]
PSSDGNGQSSLWVRTGNTAQGPEDSSGASIQRPSDNLAAKRVKDNGKEGKLLGQMQEGDIGNP